MTDIVAFLNARLEDDRAYALNAAEHVSRNWFEPFSGAVQFGGQDENPECEQALVYDSGISRHIARHDPARVLREVEAKRRTLAAIEAGDAEWAQTKGSAGNAPVSFDLARTRSLQRELAEVVLRNLAAVYADHPNYEQSWSVE